MEAKDSLVKILKALTELGGPVPRPLLMDFVMGRESRDIGELLWDEKECFGIGEAHDEDFWSVIMDAAYEAGYLKSKTVKSNSLVITPTGKKFLRRPKSFPIYEENDVSDLSNDNGLADLIKNALEEKLPAELTASPKTKQQIKIIHAIDRKKALDDFAESESLGLDEVLDDLENLVKQGRPLDITYFTDEVMGADCVDELLDYFSQAKSDDLDLAMKEYGDVYKIEELRLARVVFWVKNLKGNN